MIGVIIGDCLDAMPAMPDSSVDAVVCDPPYGLGFMGKQWDSSFEAADMPMRRSGAQDAINAGAARQGGRQRAGLDYQRRMVRDSRAYQAWSEVWAAECLRVLKPGGHLLAFGGTRTYHRLACAVEDAGFEIRDCLAWLYGAGFPKAWSFDTRYPSDQWCQCSGGNPVPYDHADSTPEHDLRSMRNADLQASVDTSGADGEVLLSGLQEPGAPPHGQADRQSIDDRGEQPGVEGRELHRAGQGLPDGEDAGAPAGEGERLRAGTPTGGGADAGAPAGAGRGGPSPQSGSGGQPTGEPADLREPSRTLDGGALRDGGRCARCGQLSQAFRGFSTALKPAFEPIVLARKPLIGTVARNVLAYSTGALHVDACRIEFAGDADRESAKPGGAATAKIGALAGGSQHDGERSEFAAVQGAGRWPANVLLDPEAAAMVGDAARFFYCAKASSKERNAGLDAFEDKFGGALMSTVTGDTRGRPEVWRKNTHPTVKPIALMRWLVRLVTPPGGLVVDPFAGSGTTGIACTLEGLNFIGIEREADYVEIARARIAHWGLA